jgi:hypothetical protein
MPDAREGAHRLVADLVDLLLARGHPPLAFGDIGLALLERFLACEEPLVSPAVFRFLRGGLARVGSSLDRRSGSRRRGDTRRTLRQHPRRDHQAGREAQGHHDRRDHDFHCVSSPRRRRPWAATRVHSLSWKRGRPIQAPAHAERTSRMAAAAAASDGGCRALLGRCRRARLPGCGAWSPAGLVRGGRLH